MGVFPDKSMRIFIQKVEVRTIWIVFERFQHTIYGILEQIDLSIP